MSNGKRAILQISCVIGGHLLHFEFYRYYGFQSAASSTFMIVLLQPNIFGDVPCQSSHKDISWRSRNIKFKKNE